MIHRGKRNGMRLSRRRGAEGGPVSNVFFLWPVSGLDAVVLAEETGASHGHERNHHDQPGRDAKDDGTEDCGDAEHRTRHGMADHPPENYASPVSAQLVLVFFLPSLRPRKDF